MNHENIMLGKRSQTQKVIYCMISFYKMSRISKSTETEIRLVVARGWVGGKNVELVVMG